MFPVDPISHLPLPLLITAVLIFSAYAGVIRRCNKILMRLPLFKASGISKESVTVVIAARNEEQHIGACLESLLQQTLPAEQLEIIVVDDGSEDKTAEIVTSYANQGVMLIRMTDEDGVEKKRHCARALNSVKRRL